MAPPGVPLPILREAPGSAFPPIFFAPLERQFRLWVMAGKIGPPIKTTKLGRKAPNLERKDL
jgi:hypothetical protein